jgi:hypothetical protein
MTTIEHPATPLAAVTSPASPSMPPDLITPAASTDHEVLDSSQISPTPSASDRPARPPATHWSHSGSPKITYPSRDAAISAIPSAAPHQRFTEPTVYLCEYGDHWHIGNSHILHGLWPLPRIGDTVRLARGDLPLPDLYPTTDSFI